ncbi:hypothetical protein [Clostridium estertheticum]|uniref:hypothetical protein n=1 Tax=Clostridium estertheticum TaxID=238834 RepID=UPI001C0DB981|nr:hypothetical protein [Clostridium estertheticum]MBU3169889.1 hypothetical protein [Clostridium estertheticum]
MPRYYVENSHKAIAPKEIFMQGQEELAGRSLGHISTSGGKVILAVASSLTD